MEFELKLITLNDCINKIVCFVVCGLWNEFYMIFNCFLCQFSDSGINWLEYDRGPSTKASYFDNWIGDFWNLWFFNWEVLIQAVLGKGPIMSTEWCDHGRRYSSKRYQKVVPLHQSISKFQSNSISNKK